MTASLRREHLNRDLTEVRKYNYTQRAWHVQKLWGARSPSDSRRLRCVLHYLATLLRSHNLPDTLFALVQNGTAMVPAFFPEGTKVVADVVIGMRGT